MKLQFKIYIAAGIAILFALSVFAAFRYGKKVADYAAHMKELEAQLDSLKKENATLQSQRVAIQNDVRAKVEGIKNQSSQATTPEKAREFVQSQVPALNAQPIIKTDSRGSEPPSVPSSDLTSVNTFALRNTVSEYEQCSIGLDGCKQELSNADSQIANLAKQNKDLQAEVKLAEHKPRHAWLNKIGECALRTSIGAVGGLAVKNRTAAILGGSLGLGSCFVF